MKSHGYIFCFLDVLGFKAKLDQLGLDELYRRYELLTESCNLVNKKYDEFISGPGQEMPLWTNDGNLSFLYRANVHYASDTIILWSERTWEMYKNIEKDDDIHFATPWIKFPRPYDPFIELCNEFICRGIELGLPLRGAISVGDGKFNLEKNHYIGGVVIDCAGMEKMHNLVGLAIGNNLFNQPVPHRYYIEFENHLKTDLEEKDFAIISNKVLDWPRHWRNTRGDALPFEYMRIDDFGKDPIKYTNTEIFWRESEKLKDLYETQDELDAFNFYKDWFNRSDGFSMRLIVQ